MFKSFTSSALLAAFSCLDSVFAQTAAIRELTIADMPPKFLEENEFSFVSFYKKSDPKSVEVDSYLEGAKAFLDAKIEDGTWTGRSLGWFRCDLDEYPEMAIDGQGQPDQMMTGVGNRRMLGFDKVFEEKERNVELLANIVRELSGDWITEIECSKIQADKRQFYDEVIYFGPKKDIEKEGTAELLNTLSMVDRYNFTEQRVGFYYNEDPACREEFNLKKKLRYIGFYHGESEPDILTVDQDFINLKQMMFTLHTGIVKGTPRWGQRAYSALYDLHQSGLIYYMKDAGTADTIRSDWRIMLMLEVNKWMQNNLSLFVPIVQSWEADDSARLSVYPLRDVLQIKEKDNLPGIFVYHPMSDTVIPYPEELTDPKLISPNLVMLWAQKETMKTEIHMLEKRLADHEADPENDEVKLTEEQIGKIKEHLEKRRPEFEELKTKHLTEKAELQTENKFSDYVISALDLGKKSEEAKPTEDL